MTALDTRILRELRARKAKYGFASNSGSIWCIRRIARILDILDSNFSDTAYTAEIIGMKNEDFRLYTDHDHVAEFVRNEFLYKEPEVTKPKLP